MAKAKKKLLPKNFEDLSSDLIKDTARMAQLAVAWVEQNPDPIPLSTPEYKR